MLSGKNIPDSLLRTSKKGDEFAAPFIIASYSKSLFFKVKNVEYLLEVIPLL